MWLFFAGLAFLVLGYYTYGRYVEKVLGPPDDRPTPGILNADGVDYVILPKWKNMLIQLLNIAGIGPVIGVILGIKFGSIVFILIPLGNIFAGAVHDFAGGMLSLRRNGSNLPMLIKQNLGNGFYRIFSVFIVFLLLLVVAVFINVPAKLIDATLKGGGSCFWYAIALIFVYYIVATLFPVDKIIGKFYPIFGLMLLIGTGALLISLIWNIVQNPTLLDMSEGFRANMFTTANDHPVLPLLFVTIACGIISGFHATQSPIVARTMRNEHEARATFYGMMVLEGIIAMIWAAGALAIYNLHPEFMAINPNTVLTRITDHFLGTLVGSLTVLAVVILAVTSGDTALRSLRLTIAECFNIPQKTLMPRIAVCIPLIVLVSILLGWSNHDQKSFGYLWNYFAWGNQVIAVFTLMAASVHLKILHRNYLITLLPAMFMTFIVASYITWISPAHKGPYGFGMSLQIGYSIGIVAALIFAAYALWRGFRSSGETAEPSNDPAKR